MEGRNIWGQSPDTFGERNAPPGLVLSSPRGLFTTLDPSLLTFVYQGGNGKVRVASGLVRNYSSNLSLLPFGSLANPAFICDTFHRQLLFLMVQ